VWVDDGAAKDGSSAKETRFPVVDQYGLQAEAFSRAIRAGGAFDGGIESAVGNMRVIDALFRSGESGRWEKV
jgi:predicted dehydrogenase